MKPMVLVVLFFVFGIYPVYSNNLKHREVRKEASQIFCSARETVFIDTNREQNEKSETKPIPPKIDSSSCSSINGKSVFTMDTEEYAYLDQLALSIDASLCLDKGSNWHNYTEVYSHYFGPIKDQPLKMLEIGIYKGGSVKLWEEYFTKAELHFIDICFEEVAYSSERSHYHYADQANSGQLLDVVRQAGGEFDIIIDDGGHRMDQQMVSFTTLFPYLKSGGMYVVEDLHTSYWKSDGGYGTPQHPKAGPGTMIEMLKDLIDDVNFVGARERSVGVCCASHRLDLGAIVPELNIYREQILGMHFYDSLCIIIKR